MKELEKIQEQLKRIRYRLDKCYEANQNMLMNLTIAHELIEKIQEEIDENTN